MKKKKLFMGLLLGAAAFSLAACTNTGNNTTTSGTAPTTVTTTDGGTTTTTTQASTKYDVKYYAVVDGVATEVTAAKQEVAKDTTTTAPADSLAKDGYKIVGYYTNAACGDEFDFTAPITEATEVYVLYEELGLYDSIALSANKVFATDFADITLKTATDYNKTAVDFAVNDTATVKVENGALTFPKNSSAFVSFGGDKGTGIYNIYFEMKFTSSGNGEGVFQLHGNEEGKEETMLFEMRNDSAGIQWSYGADQKQPFTPAISMGTSTHKFLYTLNTATGNLTIKHALDDAEMAEVYNKIVNIRGLDGVKFQGSKTDKQIDNVAVSFETQTKSDYVNAKDTLYESINSYVTEVKASTTLDAAIKDYVSKEAATTKESLAAAFTKEKVQEISTKWETFKAAEKVLVTIQPTVSGLESTKVATTVGKTLDLDSVFYPGYTMPTFYSDSECQTPYDKTTTVTSTTTIYALVNPTSEYKVQATDLTGTLNGQFKNGFKFEDSANSITIDSDRIKFAADGVLDSKTNLATDKYVAITLAAGTHTIAVEGISGSKSNNVYAAATLAVKAGSAAAQAITFDSGEDTTKSVTVTLTEATTIYMYRTGGKTVKVKSITITKTA